MQEQQTMTTFGVNFFVGTQEQLVQRIQAPLSAGECRTVSFSGMSSASQADRDPALRAVLNGMSITAMDGMPIVKIAHHRGYTQAERCGGPDIMALLLERGVALGARHYFYGSTPETLEKLRQALEKRWPGICIAGMASPPFRALTPQEDDAAVQAIREARPDYVWVILGAPKQDIWAAQHADRLPGCRVLCVGAAANFLAGTVRRAPLWMQKCGLEWLWRITQEPRQFGRYMKNGAYFACRLAAGEWRKKPTP